MGVGVSYLVRLSQKLQLQSLQPLETVTLKSLRTFLWMKKSLASMKTPAILKALQQLGKRLTLQQVQSLPGRS